LVVDTSERTIPIPGFKTAAQVLEDVNAMEFGPLSRPQMLESDQIVGRGYSTETVRHSSHRYMREIDRIAGLVERYQVVYYL
jgi:hypothetical protein